MDEKQFELISASGYNDGCYWDTRFIFSYKGKTFEFVDIGSGSGYISNFGGITILESTKDELLKDWENVKYRFEDEVMNMYDEEDLIDYANTLLESGQKDLDLWNDNDDEEDDL